MPYDYVPSELLSNFSKSNEKRMDATTVSDIIEQVAHGKDKKFAITSVSKVYGAVGRQWLLIDASGYKLWCYYKEDRITNCFAAKTPGGSEYTLDYDGGNVALTIDLFYWRRLQEEVSQLTPIDAEPERVVGIKQVWIVCNDIDTDHWNKIGGMYDKGVGKRGLSFPRELLGPGIFYTEQDAKDAMAKYKLYRQDLEDKGKKKNRQSTDKKELF